MQQLFVLFAVLGLFAPLQDNKTDRQQASAQFQHIKSIVESNHFKVVFTIATTHRNYYMGQGTPYMDENVRIESDSAFLTVNDTLASGKLPYYGTGYMFPETGNKGVVFDHKITDRAITTKGKGKKQTVVYSFTVQGKYDYYRINMQFKYDGTCYLYVNSAQRGPISYTGMLILDKVKE